MYVCSNCHFLNCFGFVCVRLFFPSSFVSFSCGLMTIFSAVFGLLFPILWCTYFSFLVCISHDVLIKQSVYVKFVLSCYSLIVVCNSHFLRLYTSHGFWFWYHICVWMISSFCYMFAFNSELSHLLFLFLVVALFYFSSSLGYSSSFSIYSKASFMMMNS